MFGGGNTPNEGAYLKLRKFRGNEHHIGDDNIHQYIQNKKSKRNDLENNIFRYGK